MLDRMRSISACWTSSASSRAFVPLDEAPRPPPRHEQTDAQADDGPDQQPESCHTCEDTNRRARGRSRRCAAPLLPAVHLTYAHGRFRVRGTGPCWSVHGRLRRRIGTVTFPRATLLGTCTENPNNTALNGLRTGGPVPQELCGSCSSVGTEYPAPCPRHVALFVSRSLSGTPAFRKPGGGP